MPAWTPIVHEKMRAWFVQGACAITRPIPMRDDIAEGDVVLNHERSGQLRRSLHGLWEAVSTVFTHFDADRIIVALAIEISVFTLLARGNVLDGSISLNGEMPGQKSNAIPAFTLGRPQRPRL